MRVTDHPLFKDAYNPGSTGAARLHRGSRINRSGDPGSKRYKGDRWLWGPWSIIIDCVILLTTQFGREFHRGVADALSELAPVTIGL
ncbi:uncharacterized protein B0T23DRAFT_325984 [Neurospora hispaniola]|uniref:Uncharacterized protein n=1 Tax=Neurospora hispaniola TaxID=588809 RepID=A0AAJ0HZJ2_9PEZI|nr:hypothetical protein B0T23DRAFT_325984 [Neurospora hispaniola]